VHTSNNKISAVEAMELPAAPVDQWLTVTRFDQGLAGYVNSIAAPPSPKLSNIMGPLDNYQHVNICVCLLDGLVAELTDSSLAIGAHTPLFDKWVDLVLTLTEKIQRAAEQTPKPNFFMVRDLLASRLRNDNAKPALLLLSLFQALYEKPRGDWRMRMDEWCDMVPLDYPTKGP